MNDTDLLEANAISFEILESMADSIFSDLCKLVNEKLIGTNIPEVNYEVVFDDSTNAGIAYDSSKIIITTGLVRSIYQDSLSFPLYSILISKDFNVEELINKVYFGNEFVFEGGMPEILDSQLTKFSRFWKDAWISAINNNQESSFQHSFDYKNTAACRFLMFELMMAWTFYHEFAHYTQRHNLLQKGAKTYFESTTIDLLESVPTESNYYSQAREILADTDAMINTLRYLLSEVGGMYPGCLYLLLSVQTCMFIRFYNNNDKYTNDLSVSFTHPHPVVRNTFLHLMFNEAMMWDVRKTSSLSEEQKKNFLVGFKYISGRANLFSVAYYTARHSIEEDDKFNYLNLIGRESEDKLRNEISIITRFINNQIPDIIKNSNENETHIHFLVSIDYFKRIERDHSAFFDNQEKDGGDNK
ncbi:hypothetical protein [Serratia fonticola]